MKLENVNYDGLARLNASKKGGRSSENMSVLSQFLQSGRYAMKLIFDEHDLEEMRIWCSEVEGREPYDWYLNKCNAYAACAAHNDQFKGKIQVRRITHRKDINQPMEIYLIRRDKTLTMGEMCQRRGYK